MAVTKTVITSVVSRAWNEIEPKLIAVAAGSLTATGLIQWGDVAGVHLTSEQAALAVGILSLIFGYIKKSTTKVAVDPAPASPAAAVDAPVA
jgi:hypothetical protein